MTKNFNAILAKNEIAREIRDMTHKPTRCHPSIVYLVHNLKIIEKYLGEGNQPSVQDIIFSERNDL